LEGFRVPLETIQWHPKIFHRLLALDHTARERNNLLRLSELDHIVRERKNLLKLSQLEHIVRELQIWLLPLLLKP
jgi:hypothetical protein